MATVNAAKGGPIGLHAFVMATPPLRRIDNEDTRFYGLSMEKLRIAWLKMLIALRLATVLSLVALPFSISPAVAHGDPHKVHDAGASMQSMPGHGDHLIVEHCAPSIDAKAKTADDNGTTTAKQECCTTFCVGVAVLTETAMPRSRMATPLRGIAPDHQVSPGEVPNLKRPPKA